MNNYDTTEDPQDEQYKRNAVRDALVNKFYSTSETAPTLDQAKVDRLQRMGRINSLGRGVNVLGDVLGTALGATVRRRQPDNISPMLYNTFQNTLDKYETDKTAYDYRGYGKKLQNISTAIGNEDYNSQRETAFKNHQDALKAARAKNAMDWAKYSNDYALKSKQYNLDVSKAQHTAGYQDVMAAASWLRAQRSGAKPDKDFMQIELDGKTVPLDEGQFWGYYDKMLKDKVFTDEQLKAKMENYQGNPLIGLKGLVQQYAVMQNQRGKLAEQQPMVDSFTKSGQLNDIVNQSQVGTYKGPIANGPAPKAAAKKSKTDWVNAYELK